MPRPKIVYVLGLNGPDRPPNPSKKVEGEAITKPYKFIRFGAIASTKPYKFIGFGAIAITKPYKFIGFGAIAFWKGLEADRAGLDLKYKRFAAPASTLAADGQSPG